MTIERVNLNGLWNYVKERFPDARFCFWFSSGELIFYPDGNAEANNEREHSCFKQNGKTVIVEHF